MSGAPRLSAENVVADSKERLDLVALGRTLFFALTDADFRVATQQPGNAAQRRLAEGR